MSKIAVLLLLLAPLFTTAQTVSNDPATVLYNEGIRSEQEGKVERARVELLTLINTYYTSPLAAKAKTEIGAVYLFRDAQAKMDAGEYRSAYFDFQAIARAYPESPLVSHAEARMAAADQVEPHNARVIRSIRFENTTPVQSDEVLARFSERELGVEVERRLIPQQLEQAKQILSDLLKERGLTNFEVTSETNPIPPAAVEVIFRVIKH